jgi:Domain of unknown function (DUF4388)
VALEGNLQDFALADVFRLLDGGAKTGTVNLERGDDRGMVCFRDGRIFFAASTWQRAPLGKRLVTAGLITEKQLRQALGLMKIQKAEKAGRRLGQVLVDEGYLASKALEQFVQESLFDTLFDLFRWEEGFLVFEQDDSCDDQDTGVYVTVDAVLQEMTRRLEQWEKIRERIPSMDTVFVAAESPGDRPAEVHLKPAEWLLLTRMHGGATVRELIQESGASDFDVARTLYAMHAAGLVEAVGERSGS